MSRSDAAGGRIQVIYEGPRLVRHLHAHGVLGEVPLDAVRLTPLTGGVSSRVLLIESGRLRLVAKQALPRLAVSADWRADPTRALREVAAIDALAATPAGPHVPQIVWRDYENFGFVMAAGPRRSRVWKDVMLEGTVDLAVVEAAAWLLTEIHRAQPGNDARQLFDDPTVFTQLRIDPFFRTVAERHPQVGGAIDEVAASFMEHRTAWCTGTSARRTSSFGMPGCCFLTMRLPSGVTRRSTSPSS